MKANELMIGDWVLDGTQIAQITSITCGGVIETTAHEFSNIEVIEPIPLTAEILERNGFGKVLDEYGMECYRYFNNAGDGYIKISLYDGGACDWIVEIVNYDKFNDNEIDYKNSCVFLKVHELQHALKLCGIDKTIEL